MKYVDALTNLKYGHVVVPTGWIKGNKIKALALDMELVEIQDLGPLPIVDASINDLLSCIRVTKFERPEKDTPWVHVGGIRNRWMADPRDTESDWLSICKFQLHKRV